MSENKKTQSPLVKSVLTLDMHFAELERLSSRIQEMELKSESDINQARRLMTYFAESAESVSKEIVDLAQLLSDARMRAEAAAQAVGLKAQELQVRNEDAESKMQAFYALTAKVNSLNQEMKELYKNDGEPLSEDERVQLTQRLATLNLQLRPLIDEALILKKQGQDSRIKILEQNADALGQSLTAVSHKLTAATQGVQLTQ